MNNIQNQTANYIIEATSNLIDNKLNQLKFDETIEATIVSELQNSENKYLVQYNDLKFYATSNTTFSYSTGVRVYVLVPQGDWTQEKIIIGSVPSDINEQLKRIFTNNLNQMIISRECSATTILNYVPNYNCIGLELYLQNIKDTAYTDSFNIGLKITDTTNSNNKIELGSIFSNQDIIGNTGFFSSAFAHYKLLSIPDELLQFLQSNKTKPLNWQLVLSNETAEQIVIAKFKLYIGYSANNFINDSMEIFTSTNIYQVDENDNIIPDTVFFELYNYNQNKIFNIEYKDENALETIYAYKYSIGAKGTELSGPYWQPVNTYGNTMDENNNIFEIDIPNQDLVFYTNCSIEEQETIYKFIWTSVENGVEIKKSEKTITYLNPNKVEVEIDIPNFNSTQPLKLSLDEGDTGVYNVYGMDGKITGSQDQEIHVITASLYSEAEGDTNSKLVPENISSIIWVYPESIENNTFILPKSGIIEEYNYNTDNKIYTPTNIKFWQNGDDWLEGRPLQFKYKINTQCYDSYTNNTVSCTIVMNDGNIYTGDITLEFGGYRSQGTPYSLNIDIVGEQKFIVPLENTSIQLKATFERIDGKELDVLPTYFWSVITNDNAPHTLEAENEIATLTIVSSNWFDGLIVQVNVEYVVENLSETIIFTEYLPIACSLNSSYRCVGPNRIVYDMYGDISYDKTPYNLYFDNSFSHVVSELEWNIKNFNSNISSHQFKIIEEKDENGNIIKKPTNELIPEAFALVNSEAVFDLVIAKKEGVTYWCQPIVTIHNRWNNEQLNNWNGQTITGEDGILTPYMAAGSKNQDNTFTGVMLGAAANIWGLYGYQNGILRFYFTEEGEAYIGNGDNDQFISLKNDDGLNIKTQNFELKVGNNSIVANNSGLSLSFQDSFSVMDYSNHGFWIDDSGLFTISTVSLDLRVDENNRITMNQDTLELRFTKDFWISDNNNNYISIEDNKMKLQFAHSFTVSNTDNSNFLKFIDNSLALQSNNFGLKAGNSYIKTIQTKISEQYVYTVLEDTVNCIIAADNITLEKYTGTLIYCSVPNNITSIAEEAFFEEEGNSQLRGIQLPNGLLEIGTRAFGRCTNIVSLIIPPSVTSIGINACESMFDLRYIEIGGSTSLTLVPDNLCIDCNNLSTIVLHSGIITIMPNAFNANNIGRQIKIWIPKTLQDLGPNVFEETALVTIYYEGSQDEWYNINTNINENVWLNKAQWHYDETLENFNKQITYEESIQVNLTNGYFYDDNYQETSYIKFIDGEVDIKASKFDLQVGKNQIIADGNRLKFIFSEDFYLGDSKNNYISFGDEYDSKALRIKTSQLELEAGHSYIRSLRSAYTITEYPVLTEDSYILVMSDDNTYYTFSDYQFQYYYASIPREYNGLPISIIGTGSSAISVDSQALDGQRRLALPETVIKISDMAFSNFTNLQNIILPNSLQEIGKRAFYQCYSLEEIYVPGTVTTIQEDTFAQCSTLKKIILGNGLTQIDIGAFANAGSDITNLSISIPLSLRYIALNAFVGQQNIDIYYEGTQNDWNGIYIDSTNFSDSTVTMHYKETLSLPPYTENIALCLSNGYDIGDEYGWENSSYIKFEDGDVDIKTNNFRLYCGSSYIEAQSNGASSTFDFVFSNGLGDAEESYIKFINSDLSIKTNSFDLNTPNLRLTDSNTTSLVNEWVLADDGSSTVSQTFQIYDFGLTLLDSGFPRVKLGLVNSYDWTNTDGSTETIPIYGLTIYDGAFQLYGSDYTAPLIWTDQGDMFIRGRLANVDEYNTAIYLSLGEDDDGTTGVHIYRDEDGAVVKNLTFASYYDDILSQYNTKIQSEGHIYFKVASTGTMLLKDDYIFPYVPIKNSNYGIGIDFGARLRLSGYITLHESDSFDTERGMIHCDQDSYNKIWIGGRENLSLSVMRLDGKYYSGIALYRNYDRVQIAYDGYMSCRQGVPICVDNVDMGILMKYEQTLTNSDGVSFTLPDFGCAIGRDVHFYPMQEAVFGDSKSWTTYGPTDSNGNSKYGVFNLHTKGSRSDKGGSFYGTWTTASSIAVTSDINQKHSVQDLNIKYSLLFDNIHPVIYKYKDGTSSRFHTGFIAQEIEQAIEDSGLTNLDFAGIVHTTEETNSYYLRYEEFIALNTWEIQKLKARVIELENQITILQNQINS